MYMTDLLEIQSKKTENTCLPLELSPLLMCEAAIAIFDVQVVRAL